MKNVDVWSTSDIFIIHLIFPLCNGVLATRWANGECDARPPIVPSLSVAFVMILLLLSCCHHHRIHSFIYCWFFVRVFFCRCFEFSNWKKFRRIAAQRTAGEQETERKEITSKLRGNNVYILLAANITFCLN